MIHVDPAHLVASELVIIAKFTFEVDPYWLVIGRCISSLVYYLLTLCRRRRQADFKTKSLPIRETKIKSFASYLHNEPISCVGLWSTTELAWQSHFHMGRSLAEPVSFLRFDSRLFHWLRSAPYWSGQSKPINLLAWWMGKRIRLYHPRRSSRQAVERADGLTLFTLAANLYEDSYERLGCKQSSNRWFPTIVFILWARISAFEFSKLLRGLDSFMGRLWCLHSETAAA